MLTLLEGTYAEFGEFVSAISAKQGVDKIDKAVIINQLIKEVNLRRSTTVEKSSSSTNDRRVYLTKNKFKYEKSKPSLSDKKKRKCYNCGTPGHYANECRRPKSTIKQVSFGKEYAIKEKDSERICRIDEVNHTNTVENEKTKRLLDSGASTHACNSSSMFETLTPVQSSIIVGDDREVKVTGRGTVKLKLENNCEMNTLILDDVALVPDLGVNSVSTGRLESQGIVIITKNGKSELLIGNTVIGHAKRTRDNPFLYEFCNTNRDVMLRIDSNKDDWTVWHRRLGHLNGAYMSKLNESLPTKEVFCEECHLNKAKKLPHRAKSQHKINEERIAGSRNAIHSDLMGPIKSSLGGCRYVLTYICSKTEYSFVYLLKNKHEQFKFFKQFKALYEKQHETKIKELRSDNGFEYFSSEFHNF